MYNQLIESYSRSLDSTVYWFSYDSNEVVETSGDDMYCVIFADAQDYFEYSIKESIEMMWELKDLSHYFDEEELEFIVEHYPDSVIANMINELKNERE